MDMKNKIIENLIISALCIVGAIYVLLYINAAVVDVPVSDYLRIINYYYEDVFDLHYLFSIECFSRVPFTFLTRIINASLFNFSTNFDRIISVIGLFIFNFVILKYVFKTFNNNILKIMTSIMVTSTSFSLISWEMLLNGTGHPHYIALALFVLAYYIYDNYYKDWYLIAHENDIKGEDLPNSSVGAKHREPAIVGAKFTSPHSDIHKKSIILFLVYVVISSLGFGGSYMVAFLFTISAFCFLFYVVNFVNNDNKSISNKLTNRFQLNNIVTIIVSALAVLLFQISNNSGEPYVHIGMKDISFTEMLSQDFTFPIRFLAKALVSSIIGVDNITFAMQIYSINDFVVYAISILIIIMLIFVLVMIIKKEYYKKYLFIMLLAFNGLANYMLIFLARYKFLDDTYGMTSRYGIQYMFLTIAVIIVLFKLIDDNLDTSSQTLVTINYKVNHFISFVSVMMLICLLSTNLTTNYHEQAIAKYRKETYQRAKDVALNIDSYSDDELPNIFEFHRGVDQIKKAFAIIKEKKYNIFSE